MLSTPTTQPTFNTPRHGDLIQNLIPSPGLSLLHGPHSVLLAQNIAAKVSAAQNLQGLLQGSQIELRSNAGAVAWFGDTWPTPITSGKRLIQQPALTAELAASPYAAVHRIEDVVHELQLGPCALRLVVLEVQEPPQTMQAAIVALDALAKRIGIAVLVVGEDWVGLDWPRQLIAQHTGPGADPYSQRHVLWNNSGVWVMGFTTRDTLAGRSLTTQLGPLILNPGYCWHLLPAQRAAYPANSTQLSQF